MIKNEYIIGSEPFPEWEKKHADTERIVLSGNISYDVFEDFADVFEHTKYQRITINSVKVLDVVYDNGYVSTYEHFCECRVTLHDVKLHVLDKLIQGVDGDYLVSGTCVYSLDGKTLYHMEEEKEISIPDVVEHIGDYVFANYENLNVIHFNEGLKSIGKYAFHGTEIECVELPDSLKLLGEGAFCMCGAEKLKLPCSIESIPYECFNLCPIETLTIPNSVRFIGSRALRSVWFTEINIPEGVEKIEYDAFEHMKRICLPSTLKEIDKDFYFEECIDDPEDVPYITVHPDNPIFFSKDGSLYYRESGKLATKCKYTKKELPRYKPST